MDAKMLISFVSKLYLLAYVFSEVPPTFAYRCPNIRIYTHTFVQTYQQKPWCASIHHST